MKVMVTPPLVCIRIRPLPEGPLGLGAHLARALGGAVLARVVDAFARRAQHLADHQLVPGPARAARVLIHGLGAELGCRGLALSLAVDVGSGGEHGSGLVSARS